MTQSTVPRKEKESPASVAAFRQAVAFIEQGKFKEGAAAFRKILLAEPENTAAWLNLGMIQRRLGHLHAALACTKRAVELAPDKLTYLTNYGNSLLDFDRKDESLAVHARAFKALPNDILVRSNYAIALREFGQLEKALKHFDALCELRPNDVKNQWERAVTLLHMGRFKEGWPAYEIRWKQPEVKELIYAAPKWTGQKLKGKTILIHEEQGFGDTILCSRYIPLVKKQGGRVILECKGALHRLLQGIPGLDTIVEPGKVKEHFDYHISMMSLPGIFKTDLTSIPPPASLHVPPAPPAEVSRLLDIGKGRLKVGIVWSGSITFQRNRKRAVPLTRFLPFAEIPGVQLYSLQKGPCEHELTDAGMEGLIPELGPHMKDFADTAATLKQLDLVIMTDSAVAHLAGSLDVPVWNLLCYNPYWLYLSERDDSPWYASMRFFRQDEPGDWDGVFKRVAAELEKIAAAKPAPSPRSRGSIH